MFTFKDKFNISSWGLAFSILLVTISIMLTACGGGTGDGGKKTGELIPTKIELTPSPSTIALGISGTPFIAKATFQDGSTADYTTRMYWESSNPAVAPIVSNTGVATGVTVNSTGVTIKATLVGSSIPPITATLTVTNAAIQTLTITSSPSNTITTAKGTGVTYTAMAKYSDGNSASVTTLVDWISSNPAVAKPDTIVKGKILTPGVGDTKITAAITQTGLAVVTSNILPLSVTPAILSSIAISPAPHVGLLVNSFSQFTAIGTYTDQTTADLTNQVSWISANPSNATISAFGLAKGISNQNYYPTSNTCLYVPNYSYDAYFCATLGTVVSNNNATTIFDPINTTVSNLLLTTEALNIPLGVSFNYSATATFITSISPNTSTASLDVSGQVKWIVGDSTIISINQTGRATGLKVGTTTVTASYLQPDGVTRLIPLKSFDITVTAAP